MWGDKKSQDQSADSPNPASPQSLGFVADVEAAAGGPGAPADASGPEVSQEEQGPGFSAFLSDEAAAGIVRLMFAPLASNDHRAWMPNEEALARTGPVVQRGLEELLDKVMPRLFLEYANRFPNTAAMVMSLSMLWWTQWSVVRRAKTQERAKAEVAEARTINAEPVAASVAGL